MEPKRPVRGRNTLYVDYRREGACTEESADRPLLRHFLLQSVLAGFAVCLILVITQLTTSLLAVAALGSTAFLVYGRPRSIEARPRNVVGGYLLSVVCGLACGFAAVYLPVFWNLQFSLFCGLAVVASMFLMSITDAEHAPAAGAAVAIVAHTGSMLTLAIAATLGGLTLSISGILLNKRLRDLT